MLKKHERKEFYKSAYALLQQEPFTDEHKQYLLDLVRSSACKDVGLLLFKRSELGFGSTG